MRQINWYTCAIQARFLGNGVENNEAERKLEKGIDDLLNSSEGMNRKEMSEEELAMLELKNLKFRNQLVKHIEYLIEARKVSEMMSESLFDVEYKITGTINSDEFKTSLKGLLPSQKE